MLVRICVPRVLGGQNARSLSVRYSCWFTTDPCLFRTDQCWFTTEWWSYAGDGVDYADELLEFSWLEHDSGYVACRGRAAGSSICDCEGIQGLRRVLVVFQYHDQLCGHRWNSHVRNDQEIDWPRWREGAPRSLTSAGIIARGIILRGSVTEYRDIEPRTAHRKRKRICEEFRSRSDDGHGRPGFCWLLAH